MNSLKGGGNTREVREILRNLMAESLEVAVTKLDDMKELKGDIEFDSVTFLDFMISIEDKFNVEITEFSKVSQHMESVGSLLEYLCDLIREERF